MALLIVDRHIKVKKTQLFKKKVVSIKMICWCKHFPSTIKISRYFYCARCLGRWICWWHRLSWSTRREVTRGITFFFISCQLIVVWGRSEDVNLSMWTSPEWRVEWKITMCRFYIRIVIDLSCSRNPLNYQSTYI